jgi:hypothetical protein
MRYRMQLTEWGNNEENLRPGFVMVTTGEHKLPGARITVRVPRTDPTGVEFSTEPLEGSAPIKSVHLDLQGDGSFDTEIPAEGTRQLRLPQQGVYCVRALITGQDGTEARTYCWVNAVAQHERKGVHVNISRPMEGQTIAESISVRASAVSYEGARIRSMTAAIDGERQAVVFRSPHDIEIPWQRIEPGVTKRRPPATSPSRNT